jgi:hypothetical protein
MHKFRDQFLFSDTENLDTMYLGDNLQIGASDCIRGMTGNPSLYAPWPIPLAMNSKSLVCGRLLAGIAGSNPAGGMTLL